MSLHDEMIQVGDRAVAASRALAPLSGRRKNAILEAMAAELDARREAIFVANRVDLEAADKAGMSKPMRDRLVLDAKRMDVMIRGIRNIVGLRDPVGAKISRWIRPNGLVIQKVRVPIGVIAIVYESRPNVTADTAVLCFKASNAVILRGGKEAMESNKAIAQALVEGGSKKGLPPYAIQLVTTTDRDAIREIVQLTGRVDLVIPRGGEGLIRAVTEHARVPVIKHYKGVCHVYVEASADPEMALRIVENAKCQYPAVCNAAEKLLVDAAVAPSFLPRCAALLQARGVELRGDEASRALVPSMKPATGEDWTTEYNDLILTVKVVPGVAEAIAHINTFGSHHSDAIVTADEPAARRFTEEVDSAAVYVNASTRFTDGGEFGMGAEIGISTEKIHARGPMGLEELTSYKYVVRGAGQIRE
ncbi:MAG: glutamate-5-semialdehyde dehydrogenase [Verrucomicrobia bacterium A1]|nr:MAG: glutamate-5-semialdehyde dehydrogenase [Verrucomicrobia bacterium A1]